MQIKVARNYDTIINCIKFQKSSLQEALRLGNSECRMREAGFIKYIFLLSILTSCIVGPKYKEPKTDTPQSWFSLKNHKEVKQSRQKNSSRWWENFGDETLNQLITSAIQENLDLKIAYQKIDEARANLSEKDSKLYPRVNAGASASRSNNFTNFAQPNKKTIFNNFSTGFDASWELDFFGAAYRSQQAYKALFKAENEAKNWMLISLTSEVAKNYMEFRNLQNQVELTKKSIINLEEIIKFNEDKNKAGLISAIDLSKSKIELINQKAILPDLQSKLSASEFSIEFLLGKQPGELENLLNLHNKFLPNLQEKLIIIAPLEAIRHRPDIKKAEQELKSATELEGIAITQMYPKVSLTSFLGFQNNRSGTLLKSQSKAFALGGAVSLPILNFGEIKANIKIYNSKKEQALLNYQKFVLLALQDVENALTSYSNQQKILDQTSEALQNSQLIVKLNKEKYKQGLISFADLLKAQNDFYQIHQQFVQNQTNFNNSAIALYKAFGTYE